MNVITATSSIDTQAIAERIKGKINPVQAKLDAVVLADSNYFCPMKTGTLQKSAIIYTQIGSGRLTWRAPYARAQYYSNYSHSKSDNPNACQKWFEAAKARWLDKWTRLVNEQYRRS